MKIHLLLIILIGLAAVAGAIIVGTSSFEGIVTDKPYEKGLKWDETRKNRENSGWKVDIVGDYAVGKNIVSVKVSDRSGAPLSGVSMEAVLGRPNTGAYDKAYAMTEKEPGLYAADMEFPMFGHWDLKVAVGKDGSVVSFDKSLYVRKEKNREQDS